MKPTLVHWVLLPVVVAVVGASSTNKPQRPFDPLPGEGKSTQKLGDASDQGAADEEKPKTPEQKAWAQVDSLNKQSLQNFLKQFPNGKLAQQAKVALELQERIASIKDGKSKRDYTVSLDVLGETWKAWQKRKPNKGVVGYFVEKGGGFNTLGWFCPDPLSGGKTGGRSTISFDERGILISPTGDGSVIAFRTGGLKFELFGGLVFETLGDDPMYFGVVEAKGLVHLKGKGKVTLPDGKTTELKNRTIRTADPTRLKERKHASAGGYEITKQRLGALSGPFLEKVVSQDGCHFAYVTRRHGKHVVVMDGVEGPEYAEITSLALSRDGRRLAYAARRDSEWFMVVDGVEGSTYDQLGTAVFSPDGKRVGYPARKATATFVVLDGQPSRGYDGIGDGDPTFSPDGRHVAYVAKKDAQVFIVLGGNAGPHFDEIHSAGPIFSDDGQHLAYTGKRGGNCYMVVDGVESQAYDVAAPPVFSPDGARVAYGATEDSKSFLVLDGQEGPVYEQIDRPVFTPDGKHVAYWAQKGSKHVVVLDGVEGKPYDAPLQGSIRFSSDGKHVAYGAKTKHKWVVVLDSREGAAYDGIYDGDPIFSPNGQHLAYAAKKGGEAVVVLDGQEGVAYDDMGPVVFSPDSRHVVHGAFRGQRGFLVMNGQEGPHHDLVFQNGPTFRGNNVFEYLAADRNILWRIQVVLQGE